MPCMGHDLDDANTTQESAHSAQDPGKSSSSELVETDDSRMMANPSLTERLDMKKQNASILTRELNSWDEYENTITELRKKYGTRTGPDSPEGPTIMRNDLLFRGQSDSNWPIETTLERTTKAAYTITKYLNMINCCASEIESLTGKTWALKSYPEICQEIDNNQDFMRVYFPHNHYGYLVYLRHHGFPSPLLDWTTSPYIAAYFAFRERLDCQKCAIYMFVERPTGLKSNCSGDVLISALGPYVKTHSRHFSQKAWYTISTQWNRETKTHTFCPHQLANSAYGKFKQDVLIKITLPRKDRAIALKQLDDYNINEFTLFQGEDALVRTMGMRMFDLQERT